MALQSQAVLLPRPVPIWGTRAIQQAPAVQQPHMRAPRSGLRDAGHRASYRQLLDVDWRGGPTGGATTGSGGPSER